MTLKVNFEYLVALDIAISCLQDKIVAIEQDFIDGTLSDCDFEAKNIYDNDRSELLHAKEVLLDSYASLFTESEVSL